MSSAPAPLFQIDILTTSEISSLKQSGVWKSDCPTPLDRLRIVRLCYWDFEGQEHTDGEIMVLDAVAESVLQIFKTLHTQKFPLAKVRLMDHYQGDDTKSMKDNNTSCFNYRAIIGGSTISIHAYGLAIDINPIQNPFIQFPEGRGQKARAIYGPEKGRQYANRLQHRPDKPFRPGMAEQVIDVFKENGFTVWGGHWDTPIDYQHFQVPRAIAEQLIKISSEEAKAYFLK
jgi:hypothetical protein